MGPVNRPLDLEWIEDFLALAESGNFSRAAQARNIAQPAFSRHIRSLEEWAGVELVDRTQHPALVTAAGEVIAATARDVVLRLSQARTQAHEVQEQAAQRLRFAATHVLSLAFFPGWLQQIEQRLPVQLGPIDMTTDSFKACEELLLHRRVQFLLCYGHPAVPTRLLEPDFECARVGNDRLVPVSAPDASGAARHRVEGAGGIPVSILVYSEQSWLGQIMRVRMPKVYDPKRFKPVVTSHHAGVIKNLALAGRGLAWLPLSLLGSELADGRLVAADQGAGDGGKKPADEWQMPVEIHLFRAAAAPTPMAQAFWEQAAKR